MANKRAGIIGATGYTGSELVRILAHHPEVEITAITSESSKGSKFSDVHPFFRGIVDTELISINDIADDELDVAFLALPHGISMDFVKSHADAPYPIIDLSGDFRLTSPAVYEQWYKKQHIHYEGFGKAVYGLPELFRDKIKGASLIANPGCYPTGAILGIAPLLKNDIINNNIIVDAKSGITGAGVKASAVTHYSNVNENFKAYGISTHRHTIEIEESLKRHVEKDATIQFTPHLLPIDRGILSTIYSKPVKEVYSSMLKELYEETYRDEPFVRMVEQPPEVKNVRGSNYCDIYSTFDERTGNIITICAIDNLVKGAAGQAVQNMNILFDLDEATGLKHIPLNP